MAGCQSRKMNASAFLLLASLMNTTIHFVTTKKKLFINIWKRLRLIFQMGHDLYATYNLKLMFMNLVFYKNL